MRDFKNNIKIFKNKTQLLSYSQLYSYLKKFLSYKISPLITKRIFLLATYDFLTGKIDFPTFVYIISELGFQLNNFSDLLDREGALASIILDLDELEEEKLFSLKDKDILDLEEKLINYYKSSLPKEYHIRKTVINKLQYQVSKSKSISEIKDLLVSLTRAKKKPSLGEIAAFSRMAVSSINKLQQPTTKNKEEKYFIHILERVSDLTTNWFLETEENYSSLIQTLADIAVFPEKSDRILKRIIKEYFDNKISASIATKALLDVRNWAVFVQDRKIIKATEPLKDLSTQGEQEALRNSLNKCLRTLEG
ncbi:MAG: hypothetical protein CH104c_0063 [Candidatus Woesebacteria bacterium]|jgi:hypothetical protein|nr:MAG: hypothetical protein CH104c_0063 [Candidatus Woesebacteria bacterium]